MKMKHLPWALLAVVIALHAAESDYVMLPALTAADLPPDIHDDSRSRLPRVQREALDAVGQDAFDTYVRPGTGYETGLRGPIGMWMHSPVLAKAMFDVRQRVRYGSAKDQRLTELTILTTAREIDNQYIYTAHEPAASREGLEQGIIDIVRFREPLDDSREVDGLGEAERVIIAFTRELIHEEKVSPETFARAIDVFGNEGVMDLTGLIAYYNFTGMTIRAFDVQREPGSDRLLPVRAE